MTFVQVLASKLRLFRVANAGAAAVEFALVLPIMLFLYVGANEASVLISMDRKVQLISGAVGDLVARSDSEIHVGEVADYVKVASGIISPYAGDQMEQIVSQVVVLADGTAEVVWSQGFRNQQPVSELKRAAGSEYVLPEAVMAIAEDDFVIVAETRLPYNPLYGLIYKAPVTLYRENFFMPRFGGQIKLVP